MRKVIVKIRASDVPGSTSIVSLLPFTNLNGTIIVHQKYLMKTNATFSQASGSVSGTLTLSQDSVEFRPTEPNELTGGTELHIPVSELLMSASKKDFVAICTNY